MAIFGVGVMVGPTLGPTLGGYITDAFGWPWIFYINIPIGMLALALSLSFIQNSRFQEKAERVDRSEEHTSELQSRLHLVCRLLLEKKKKRYKMDIQRHVRTPS